MKTQDMVLDSLRQGEKSLKELTTELGKTKKAIYRAIDKLRAKGYVIDYDYTSSKYRYIGGVDDAIDNYISKQIQRIKDMNERKSIRDMSIMEFMRSMFRDALSEVDFGKVVYKDYYDDSKSDQAIVMVLSDVHFGRVTPSFNPEIVVKRLEKHIDSMLKIAKIEGNDYNNVELDIFMVGDIVDGETLFPTQPFNIEFGVVKQVTLFAGILANKIATLKQYFPKINIYCVQGNHGRVTKYSSHKTNWDMMMYYMLEQALQNVDGIEFYYPEDDSNILIADVMNHKFLLTHGDVIRMHYQVPYYGITNKTLRWFQTFDGIDYFVFGHFHHHSIGTQLINTEYFINGSYLTDDEFSKMVIGTTNNKPTQIVFGVHKKYGVTWRYPLYIREE